MHEQDHAYILQNDDGRVAFVIPYEGKYSLIGTTDVAINSVAEGNEITDAEIEYLLGAVNRYFSKSLHASDVVWSYAGVRPLYDDGADDPASITRDYVLKVNDDNGKLPVLSIFGGKITTYRRLAERALDALHPYFLQHSKQWQPWTATTALPGGAFDDDGGGGSIAGGRAKRFAQSLFSLHAGVPPDYLERLVLRHGVNATAVFEAVGSR